MNKLSSTIIVILGVILIGAGIFCFTLIQDKNDLTTELQATQIILNSTQKQLDTTGKSLASTQEKLTSTLSDLNTTKVKLTSTESELGTTKDTLASTKTELITTNQTLASKITELTSTTAKLTAAQASLSTLQKTIDTTQKQLTTAQETLRGLGMTLSASYECWDVRLVDNTEAKNPTWNELKAFLAKDKTDENTYILNTYDCSQFSRDVHNNAEAAGIRAAEVQVTFEGERIGHALNAFITSDYGLVYIDCTESPDKVAYIIKGNEFKGIELSLFPVAKVRDASWWNSLTSYYSLQTDTGRKPITESIEIYW
jgi:hypothetical protein